MTNVAKCNRDNTIHKEQQIQEVKNFFNVHERIETPTQILQ